MSMSNEYRRGFGFNIKIKEFVQFLNIARRSTFENANILILLQDETSLDKRNFRQALRSAMTTYVTDFELFRLH